MRHHKPSPVSSLFNIAMPAMIENTLQLVMGMVDSFFVASLGMYALSGVSVATTIISVYQAIFIALGTAVSALVARYLSQRDDKRLGSSLMQAEQLTWMVGVFLGGVSVIGASPMLDAMRVEGAVNAYGRVYLSLVGGGIVLLGLMTVYGAAIRASGRPKLPMWVSLFTNGINILLSALSVFVWHLGITGVAVSTVVARGCGLWMLRWHLHLPKAKWRLGVDKALIGLSLPTAGERLMMRLGDVAVLVIIAGIGTEAIAGDGIGEVLTQFNYMPGLALATATVILVAQETEPSAIRRIAVSSFWLSSALMGLVAGLVCLLTPLLLPAFTQDGVVVDYARMIVWYALFGTFTTAGALTYTAVWQGIGDAKKPFYATSVGMWVIRVGLAIILVYPLDMGLAGVRLAMIGDNGLRFAYLWWRLPTQKRL